MTFEQIFLLLSFFLALLVLIGGVILGVVQVIHFLIDLFRSDGGGSNCSCETCKYRKTK